MNLILKKHKSIFLIGIAAIIIVVGFYILKENHINHLTGWQRAEYFIAKFSEKNNISDRIRRNHEVKPVVKPDTDIQLFNGAEIFRFDTQTGVLTVKMFTGDGHAITEKKDTVDKFMKFYNALSDPKIGGMFDKAGGYFTHSDDWKEIYLTKDYKINDFKLDEFLKQVDYQERVNNQWFSHWGVAVANIVHQGKPIPTQPVTLENNPYK